MKRVESHRRARLVRQLASGDLAVMAEAATGLAALGARDELRDALRSANPYVREFAASALMAVATDADVPRYVALLDDRDLQIADVARVHLATVGIRAVPLVTQRILQQPASVSLDAVELLGEIGDAAAVPALEEVIAHGDDSLREEAMDALARIGGLRARAAVEAMLQSNDEDERRRAASLIHTWE